MSRNILAIFRLFFIRVLQGGEIFHSFRERERERERERKYFSVERIECSKKALFCGDCYDKNQVITLVALVGL